MSSLERDASTVEVFGLWQTEVYVPPPVVDVRPTHTTHTKVPVTCVLETVSWKGWGECVVTVKNKKPCLKIETYHKFGAPQISYCSTVRPLQKGGKISGR